MSWQREGDTITQRVRTEFADSLEVVDASTLDEDALREKVAADYRRPFDLEHGEPARLHVYTRGGGDHVLLLVAHHIACDGWSLWVLLSDLKDLYTSRALTELPASYLDFVHAEAETLASAEAERQWTYWREQLAGNLEALDLPLDRPRAARHVRQGASFPIELPEDLTAELRRVAQANGVTLFTVLAAGLNTLLHRYSGQSDVLVGTPTAGRTERRFAGVVGHFINQVVLRTDFSDDPRFDTLLARTRDTVLNALANQDLPFALLVERLKPNRDPNRTPIFDVNFVFQQAQTSSEILGLVTDDGSGVFDWGALQLRAYPFHQQEGQFDLTVELLDADTRLVGHLKYDAALFDRETIARFETHFRNLLRAAARTPERRVSTLPMLDAEEREALLERRRPRRLSGRRPGAVPPESRGETPPAQPARTPALQSLFEEQVSRTPTAQALSLANERVTYADLNTRANQLAHRLRELGVGRESLVALRLAPSIDTIVAILGTLKAGGGYLPIDLSYPDDRAAFMISDSGARVVIDAAWLQRESNALREQSTTNPSLASGPENIAYCIYTSGTTGRPKGVLIEHRQVTRLFDATQHWFHFDDTDVWTLFHSYAFDFSVWEIWGALLHGGRLVIVPYLTARSPEAFHRLVVDEGVTILNQTPSAFRQFMAADAASAVTELPLRAVIFGGEALDSRMLAPWFERHPSQPQLINMYGITETTVHVTYAPVTASAENSIGRAIPDLQTYVLDSNFEPVPVGVRGELYVGGAGLARGYLARPELTAERFVPNPFTTTPGARLYRTGDVGSYRADGTIEYHGRIDRQVKIRGFRIERGEIEAELRKHPLVDEAIVLARDAADRSTTLAAYVIAKGEQPAAATLRHHLRRSLPEYMVPSSITVLDRLPLTNNGKIDHAALAKLDVPRPRTLAAPASDTERAVAAVWREVLAIDEVGRHDNFFDLGGHSLLVPQVHRRLTERFSSEISIVDLFRYPTVGDLAQFLAGVADVEETSAGVARAELRQARRRARA
jgi:amino acid adenylation domain-containing protein